MFSFTIIMHLTAIDDCFPLYLLHVAYTVAYTHVSILSSRRRWFTANRAGTLAIHSHPCRLMADSVMFRLRTTLPSILLLYPWTCEFVIRFIYGPLVEFHKWWGCRWRASIHSNIINKERLTILNMMRWELRKPFSNIFNYNIHVFSHWINWHDYLTLRHIAVLWRKTIVSIASVHKSAKSFPTRNRLIDVGSRDSRNLFSLTSFYNRSCKYYPHHVSSHQ